MPGKFVFPGGRIEPGDRRMRGDRRLDADLRGPALMRAQRPPEPSCAARALALAAIRETFEETGLLFGTAGITARRRSPRRAWSEFAGHGVFPDLDAVTFVARAITPPRRPKRFDTRFFAVDRAAHRPAKSKASSARTPSWSNSSGSTFDEAAPLDLPTITPGDHRGGARPHRRRLRARTCRCRSTTRSAAASYATCSERHG